MKLFVYVLCLLTVHYTEYMILRIVCWSWLETELTEYSAVYMSWVHTVDNLTYLYYNRRHVIKDLQKVVDLGT